MRGGGGEVYENSPIMMISSQTRRLFIQYHALFFSFFRTIITHIAFWDIFLFNASLNSHSLKWYCEFRKYLFFEQHFWRKMATFKMATLSKNFQRWEFLCWIISTLDLDFHDGHFWICLIFQFWKYEISLISHWLNAKFSGF